MRMGMYGLRCTKMCDHQMSQQIQTKPRKIQNPNTKSEHILHKPTNSNSTPNRIIYISRHPTSTLTKMETSNPHHHKQNNSPMQTTIQMPCHN